jgi:Transposase IS200 like
MSFWRTYYHIVWATKNREALITPQNEPRLYGYIVNKAAELGVYVYTEPAICAQRPVCLATRIRGVIAGESTISRRCRVRAQAKRASSRQYDDPLA